LRKDGVVWAQHTPEGAELRHSAGCTPAAERQTRARKKDWRRNRREARTRPRPRRHRRAAGTGVPHPQPPPLPRTNRTSLVPPLVLSGHALSAESTLVDLRKKGGQALCDPAAAPGVELLHLHVPDLGPGEVFSQLGRPCRRSATGALRPNREGGARKSPAPPPPPAVREARAGRGGVGRHRVPGWQGDWGDGKREKHSMQVQQGDG